jgi:predicted enzyme related to lactoylglutathione lyase
VANPVVHFEVEATDIERAKKFYSSAFGWGMDQMGTDFGNYVVIKTTDPPTPITLILANDSTSGLICGIFFGLKTTYL